MEPNKQGGEGPSDLDASNDPAQRRDGPSSRQPPPSSLVEQTTPPPLYPPQLLQYQQQPYPRPPGSNFSPFGFPGLFASASAHPHQPFANQQLAPSLHQLSLPSNWAPMPSSSDTAFSLFSPNAILNPHASHRASTPSFSAIGPHQPGAATDYSLRGPNASLNPYASAGLPAPPANLTDPLDQRLWIVSQMICGLPHPEFRAALLKAPTRPGLLTMSQKVSTRVASMLDQGDQELRVWVIQAVSGDVHSVMGNESAYPVFLALLGAVAAGGEELGEEQLQELRIIVGAAARRSDRNLMSVAISEPGVTALKELFRVVMRNEELCKQLFNCLVDGWRMEQHNGPELLEYLFTELGYLYCSIFIHRVAVPRFANMVTSELGLGCMLLCLENAKGDAYTEFPALKQAILSNTADIAKSQYGNLFLQEILKSDRHVLLKESIRARLEKEDLHELSTHPSASNVIEACYVPHPAEPVLPLVQRGLDAFKALSDTQLVQLAHDRSASRVLRNLLGAGKDIEPPSAWSRTMNLARRIKRGLGSVDQINPFARQMMEVLQEVLSYAATVGARN